MADPAAVHLCAGPAPPVAKMRLMPLIPAKEVRPPLSRGPFLVVGLARSGQAAAHLLAARGERVRAVELRYYLVAPHYRSTLEYSEHALAEAAAAYRRIETFVHRVQERIGAVGAQAAPEVMAPFAAAMDDDLGTPAALAVVHDQVRAGNTALDEGDREAAVAAAAAVREMTGVLGLDPLDPHWTSGSEGATGGDHARAALGALVGDLLGQRTSARRDKDFARADAIRGQLTAAGVGIEDTPDGPIWTLKDDES